MNRISIHTRVRLFLHGSTCPLQSLLHVVNNHLGQHTYGLERTESTSKTIGAAEVRSGARFAVQRAIHGLPMHPLPKSIYSPRKHAQQMVDRLRPRTQGTWQSRGCPGRRGAWLSPRSLQTWSLDGQGRCKAHSASVQRRTRPFERRGKGRRVPAWLDTCSRGRTLTQQCLRTGTYQSTYCHICMHI